MQDFPLFWFSCCKTRGTQLVACPLALATGQKNSPQVSSSTYEAFKPNLNYIKSFTQDSKPGICKLRQTTRLHDVKYDYVMWQHLLDVHEHMARSSLTYEWVWAALCVHQGFC